MGDFLGSYYANFLEDEGISDRMALLKAEQPVSILAMEKLISSRQPQSSSAGTEKPNRSSSSRRLCTIDDLHIRSGKGTDFASEKSRILSLDDPDLEIPVASMSLFEQDSMMISVQLKSLQGGALKKSCDNNARVEYQDLLRVRSRSSTEIRAKHLDTFSPRPQTIDLDIESPKSGTESSLSSTPRTGDPFFGSSKRTSTLRTSLLKLLGRKKKHEDTSKRR